MNAKNQGTMAVSTKFVATNKARNRDIIVDSVEDLLPLLARFTLTGLRTGRVVLNLPWFTVAENQLYSTRVNNQYKACGCSEGTVAGLIGTVLAVSFFLINSLQAHWIGTNRALVISIVVVFCFMAIGKAAGLIRAKHKLLDTIREITQSRNISKR